MMLTHLRWPDSAAFLQYCTVTGCMPWLGGAPEMANGLLLRRFCHPACLLEHAFDPFEQLFCLTLGEREIIP